MIDRRNQNFALGMMLLWASLGAGAQTISYSDSSFEDALRSKIGLSIEDGGISLGADMTLEGQDGQTKVVPRVTSGLSYSDRLDIKTVLLYDDWNQTTDAFLATIDSSAVLRLRVPFLDLIEGSVRRAPSASSESIRLAFSEIDSGLRSWRGNPIGLKADLTVHAQGEQAEALSSIGSSLGIGDALDVGAVRHFEDGLDGDPSRTTFYTKLALRPLAPFIDQLDGEVRRSSSGASQQTVAVRFAEISNGAPYGTPFTIRSRATLEETGQPDEPDTVRMGIETKVAGFMPPLIGGSNTLSLKLERRLDAEQADGSVAYDHSWTPGDFASIALNVKVVRATEDLEPSMGLTWKKQF